MTVQPAQAKINPADIADNVVDGVTDAVTGFANGIPFLNLGDRIKNSPAVQNMQSSARTAITTQGSDQTSLLGKLFSWVADLWSGFMGWLNKLLPTSAESDATPPTTPTTTPPAAPAKQPAAPATTHDTNGPAGAPATPGKKPAAGQGAHR